MGNFSDRGSSGDRPPGGADDHLLEACGLEHVPGMGASEAARPVGWAGSVVVTDVGDYMEDALGHGVLLSEDGGERGADADIDSRGVVIVEFPHRDGETPARGPAPTPQWPGREHPSRGIPPLRRWSGIVEVSSSAYSLVVAVIALAAEHELETGRVGQGEADVNDAELGEISRIGGGRGQQPELGPEVLEPVDRHR